jgi:hypothetical protein
VVLVDGVVDATLSDVSAAAAAGITVGALAGLSGHAATAVAAALGLAQVCSPRPPSVTALSHRPGRVHRLRIGAVGPQQSLRRWA